jgi:L-alanine-DL-glutamate epimerase-like enolase superfamily enzyme
MLQRFLMFELFPFTWLENPFAPEDVDALKEVKSSRNNPIASGENLGLFEGFVGFPNSSL